MRLQRVEHDSDFHFQPDFYGSGSGAETLPETGSGMIKEQNDVENDTKGNQTKSPRLL